MRRTGPEFRKQAGTAVRATFSTSASPSTSTVYVNPGPNPITFPATPFGGVGIGRG